MKGWDTIGKRVYKRIVGREIEQITHEKFSRGHSGWCAVVASTDIIPRKLFSEVFRTFREAEQGIAKFRERKP